VYAVVSYGLKCNYIKVVLLLLMLIAYIPIDIHYNDKQLKARSNKVIDMDTITLGKFDQQSSLIQTLHYNFTDIYNYLVSE